MTASRQITKALAGQQDLLLGEGSVVQARYSGNVTVDKLNLAKWVVDTTALSLVDTSIFTRALVGNADIQYRWSAGDTHTPDGDIYVAGSGGNWVQTNRSTQRISTLAKAKTLTGSTTRDIFIAGRTSAGDGYPGRFYWDSSDNSANVTADTQNAVYVPPDSDNTGASGVWIRYDSGLLDVGWFGAPGDGTDQTTAISAAFSLMEYRRTVLAFNSLNRSLQPFVYFPYGASGKYRTSAAISITRVLGITADKGVYIYSTESTKHHFVTSTNCESALVENACFGGFDTAFNISSGNISYSRYTFNNIELMDCEIGIDTNSFANSRSTVLSINGVSCYSTETLVKSYCDMTVIRDGYLSHTVNAGPLILIDGHGSIKNCIMTPGNVTIQTDVRWIDFYASEAARRLSIEGCRFGSEFGGCTPLVVQSADVKSVISFNNCWIQNGNGQLHYDSKRSSVVLEDYPGVISFKDCWIDNSILNDGVVTTSAAFSDTPHDDFRIDFDAASWLSASEETDNTETLLANYLRYPGQDPGLNSGTFFQSSTIGNGSTADLARADTTGNYFIVAGNTHGTNTWHQVWHAAKDTATSSPRITSIDSSTSAGLTLDLSWPNSSKPNIGLSGGTFVDTFDVVYFKMGL